MRLPQSPEAELGLTNDQNIETMFRSAVIANWADLARMPASEPLLQIEYQLRVDGTVDSVQVWSSVKRGYWLRVCSYWMSGSKSHVIGIHFDNGYESEGLTRVLTLLMRHQHLFPVSVNTAPTGVLQVINPTENDLKTAKCSITTAFARENSFASGRRRDISKLN